MNPSKHQVAGRLALAALLLAGVLGCVNTNSQRGVRPVWREVPADSFARGVTTRSEVLELLGPPSQILTLEGETVLYYLNETMRAKGVVLIVYNDRKERTDYDRAVFFFDEQDLLTDHALSKPVR